MATLNMLRLSVLHTNANENLFQGDAGKTLVMRLLHLASNGSVSVQATVCMLLSNALVHKDGQNAMTTKEQIDAILTTLPELEDVKKSALPKKESCTLRIAVATLLLNLSVVINKTESGTARCECVNVVGTLLNNTNDPESKFRLLVALGTLISEDDMALATARSQGLFALVNSFCLEQASKRKDKDSEATPTASCAQHLLEMLSAK